jgi:hypothetical protein
MICTKCNELIKPVVAIDIDGTLGNYHAHFLNFAEDYIGHPIVDPYLGERPFKEWFLEVTEQREHVWHDIKLAYRQGGQKRSMPVYRGAADLCDGILAAGAELWITTTRPYIRHDNVDPDTREWLRRNAITFDYLIYDGAKYQKLADLVDRERVVVVMDDLVEELENADRALGREKAILRKTKWNARTTWDWEFSDLYQAQQEIVKRIVNWKRNHAGHPEGQ